MVRETSIEIFNKIRGEGLLSERRQQIYEALYAHGPCTANELFKKTRGISTVSQANIQPRLNELVKLGVARECGVRVCSVTSNRVIEYDVTSSLPVKTRRVSRRKCEHCNGLGYVLPEEQGTLF